MFKTRVISGAVLVILIAIMNITGGPLMGCLLFLVAVQGLFAGVASGIGGAFVLNLLKKTNNTIYITMVAAIAMAVSLVLMIFLPKSGMWRRNRLVLSFSPR